MTHLWWVLLLVGVAHGALLFRTGARRAIVASVSWGTLALLGFVLFPYLAGRGWLPFSAEAGICEESPGSGCSECTATAFTPAEEARCYESRVRPWALAYAAWGPIQPPSQPSVGFNPE